MKKFIILENIIIGYEEEAKFYFYEKKYQDAFDAHFLDLQEFKNFYLASYKLDFSE